MKTRSIERVFHLVSVLLYLNQRLRRCLKNIDGGSFFAAPSGRKKAKDERFESAYRAASNPDFTKKSGLFLLCIADSASKAFLEKSQFF